MVLENKLGIDDSTKLAREEERLSKRRAIELYDSGGLDRLDPGTFESLATIHRSLFCDVYDFAGQIRAQNLAKGGFRFAPVMYLEASLRAVESMPQSTFDEIVDKYVEMNVIHPFREGNGRAMRIWLDRMLKAGIGKVVDWSLVDKEDYLLAMERSPVRSIEIKHVLREALTDLTDDRDIFMKGIDHSYYYEGYLAYETARL